MGSFLAAINTTQLSRYFPWRSSQLYSGSISDKEIVSRSGFLDLPFDEKDCVMADKGFTIDDMLPLGVSLNIPPFLGENSQMFAEDVIKTGNCQPQNTH